MQEAMSHSLSGIIEDSYLGLRWDEGEEFLPYHFFFFAKKCVYMVSVKFSLL